MKGIPNPMPKGMKRIPVEIRLDRYTDKSAGPDACWPWTGCLVTGLPKITETISQGGKSFQRHFYARRVIYSMQVGKIPKDRKIYTRCGSKLCCNPSHMTANKKEIKSLNSARLKKLMRKLPRDVVDFIRRMYWSKEMKVKGISEITGVPYSSVIKIGHGEMYEDIPMPEDVKVMKRRPVVNKLTRTDILEIRRKQDSGESTSRELADEYKVDFSHIRRIVKRELHSKVK